MRLLIWKVGDLAVLSIASVSRLEQGCCHCHYIVHDSRHLGNTEIDIIFKESLLINNEAALLIWTYNFYTNSVQLIYESVSENFTSKLIQWHSCFKACRDQAKQKKEIIFYKSYKMTMTMITQHMYIKYFSRFLLCPFSRVFVLLTPVKMSKLNLLSLSSWKLSFR